ncbi:N-acetylglucosamine-6-phosphate deacetylase [Palleronia marisminoris]|uniref:N-acetylglucosamine-6-phosphate deacetylase n=1 Tax=Palleronia marisminoris TaxID=315423 RepID=A0A1Y5S3X8_9RHOB|nr:N-acetylglucosamine-6-phosphate deacetylase [Palleronia marisminoris]SFG63154.1 N-acetylglucosamine-6-phosphate deacetylase [Palleronia marisminoris]SLN32148.1 N-acetylglucosamine-6-phosphate deacetylase [Palleronia marisminoris]
MTSHIDGSILTPGGWVAGRLTHDARIDSVEGDGMAAPKPPYVLPGFVDCHVHGGGGADMMEGAEAIRTAARLHAQHGTTAFCPTSVTAPIEDLDAFLDAVATVMADPPKDGAWVLGAHLEGPFLNPDKLGAQPPFARPADAEQLRAWTKRATIRIMTFAPEMDEGDALFDALTAAEIRAQLGHSLCDYAQGKAALERGAGITHLFNAMSGIAHRGNGLCGAAFAHGDYAEIIPDLIHLEAGAILAGRRAIPNLYGVTDATAGAGMPDGAYRLGSYDVQKAYGAMRLADGTLAGSALTMDVALRNLVGIGLPLDEAARRLSTVPADWLGLSDIGRLAPGARADILVLDETLTLTRVISGGHDILTPR